MGLIAFFSNPEPGPEKEQEEKFAQAQKDDTSLGNILLEKGYVSEDALERAIRIQKSQSLLGRILVNMGPDSGGITEEQLEEALLEQKIRRKKAKASEVIKANSKRHDRLVEEVQDQLTSLDRKYATAGEE
jgi:hypothetical protein